MVVAEAPTLDHAPHRHPLGHWLDRLDGHLIPMARTRMDRRASIRFCMRWPDASPRRLAQPARRSVDRQASFTQLVEQRYLRSADRRGIVGGSLVHCRPCLVAQWQRPCTARALATAVATTLHKPAIKFEHLLRQRSIPPPAAYGRLPTHAVGRLRPGAAIPMTSIAMPASQLTAAVRG